MLRGTFLNNRFFIAMAFFVMLFICAFSWPFLFFYVQILFAIFVLICFLEWFLLLKYSDKIECSRKVLEKLSLGDVQHVQYTIINNSGQALKAKLYDELPFQFQHRSYILDSILPSKIPVNKDFEIRPTERGSYNFGDMHLYIRNRFPGFIERRKTVKTEFLSEVHPSIIQMRKYHLQVFSRTASLAGVRQVRKIGENDEFEYIKPYLQGDNIKSINWKATSRKNDLMVNQYQNTRSQTVYCIVDKGRSMKMPFFGMTLLDHAINSTLVISNIILKKYDKVGLISYSDKIGSIVRAKAMTGQLEKISSELYNQKTEFKESNFELLYYTTRKQINQRSIILFFTNFEQQVDLERNLPYLSRIGKKHLLVVILFINTELLSSADMECSTKSDIYVKTFSERALNEKEKIAHILNINGIQTILTKPEDLSINVINKYLEIKNKRMS